VGRREEELKLQRLQKLPFHAIERQQWNVAEPRPRRVVKRVILIGGK
jgi:hypothetical protein